MTPAQISKELSSKGIKADEQDVKSAMDLHQRIEAQGDRNGLVPKGLSVGCAERCMCVVAGASDS